MHLPIIRTVGFFSKPQRAGSDVTPSRRRTLCQWEWSFHVELFSFSWSTDEKKIAKMDGMLSLYWNNHKATFCHILATLREKERYTDATLACEGKFYPVHKLVLSTCSEYFELMFENTPCKHPIIVLKDIKPDELEALLSYMYAGVVSVAQNDLARLIKAAELLQIKGLAVPDEPPSTEDNKRPLSSRDSREQRSPQPKRRRREENGSLPSNSPSTSPKTSPYPHDSESRTHSRTLSENNRSEQRQDSLDPSTSQESSESDVKVMVDETLVKEEAVETIDDSQSERLDFMPLSDPGLDNPGGEDPLTSNKYEQPGGLSGQAQPIADAVAEALAGPSGMQGWLGVGDMPSGFSSENYGGEGSQDVHGSPGQASGPQAQQRVERPTPGGDAGGRGGGGGYQWTAWRPEGGHDQRATRMAGGPSIFSCAGDGGGGGGGGGGSLPSQRHRKQYQCPYCSYSSYVRTNLKNHIHTHTGERPYSCPYCSMSFTTKSRLQSHVRIHTGEKPFHCTECPYRAPRKDSLQRHMLTHLEPLPGLPN
ncbi:longitudinals lacking protein, isoforms H/M/V-like isoform X9 [Macrobrachium rosenbergii]|uniref:longitudinals lacking protein, isoforms H/M/V-like isoform X9 n=1 Tax=Macrobrachium rosenbergii TaxID=79674 RepID=UPI0034D52C8D